MFISFEINSAKVVVGPISKLMINMSICYMSSLNSCCWCFFFLFFFVGLHSCSCVIRFGFRQFSTHLEIDFTFVVFGWVKSWTTLQTCCSDYILSGWSGQTSFLYLLEGTIFYTSHLAGYLVANTWYVTEGRKKRLKKGW